VEINAHDQKFLGAEAWIYALEEYEAAEHEASASQENKSNGEFRDDKDIPDAAICNGVPLAASSE
jgi:hypothetical protein